MSTNGRVVAAKVVTWGPKGAKLALKVSLFRFKWVGKASTSGKASDSGAEYTVIWWGRGRCEVRGG